MAQGQRTQPDRTDACAPHEARRNLPDQRAHESATAAPPWLMRDKGVVPEGVAGGFNRSALMQRIRPSDRQGTVLKARRVGDVRAPGFRSAVLDTSTPRRTLLRSRPALLCMHNKARPGEPRRGNQRDSRPPTHVLANPDEATSVTQDRQRKSSTSHAPEPRGPDSGAARSVDPRRGGLARGGARRVLFRRPVCGAHARRERMDRPSFAAGERRTVESHGRRRRVPEAVGPGRRNRAPSRHRVPGLCETPPCSSARTGSPTSYGR